MAQSSSYKQYARSTRVLTEESGFSGGMLWTGNNIDEAHLKAVVNCDYDDTTGYLKTRDPFLPVEGLDSAPIFNGDTSLLSGYTLMGAYNICPQNADKDFELDPAGWLYIFAAPTSIQGAYRVQVPTYNLVCIFRDSNDTYHLCDENFEPDVVLQSTMLQNTLLLHENRLYGIGTSGNGVTWLKVYYLECYEDEPGEYTYFVGQQSDATTQRRIDSVTLLEAQVSGFNAARGEDTFIYPSKSVAPEEPVRFGGVWLSDSGTVTVSPRVGQEVQVNVPVEYHADHTPILTVFQLKENADTATTEPGSIWEYVTTCVSDMDTDGMLAVPLSFKHIFKKKETAFLMELHSIDTRDMQLEDILKDIPTTAYTETASIVDRMVHTITANNNADNLKVKAYDLSKATGSCMWRNRMCLWGTESNNNCLFLSEVDNFYYYPVPNNVAVFDTNIISCIPYKDTLLVFTADKIYRMSESNDGTFIQTIIQNDMPLSQKDAAHLIAIKNMVLFKSGNYFYMIVPKAQSLTDELTIAPIYKNIAGFLNNLDKSTLEVLQLLYPEYYFNGCTISNSPASIYSEQDTVHILYNVTTNVTITDGSEITSALRSFKMFLNYNTNLRAWTLYLIDTTDATLEVAALNTARRMSFVRINRIPDKPGNTTLFEVVTQQPSSEATDGFRILLDTGYRTLSAATQKRFREVQLKLYSSSENITAFGTAFLVDGVWRRNYSKLSEVNIADNTVSLLPELDLNTFVTELSMPVADTGDILKSPGSDSIELSDWTLDFSHFKREAPVTVRVPVSGKGFNPRFIFMAPDVVDLTINEINWVYRLMHGR